MSGPKEGDQGFSETVGSPVGTPGPMWGSVSFHSGILRLSECRYSVPRTSSVVFMIQVVDGEFQVSLQGWRQTLDGPTSYYRQGPWKGPDTLLGRDLLVYSQSPPRKSEGADCHTRRQSRPCSCLVLRPVSERSAYTCPVYTGSGLSLSS